jgi:hypothetical protein
MRSYVWSLNDSTEDKLNTFLQESLKFVIRNRFIHLRKTKIDSKDENSFNHKTQLT